MVRVCSGRNKTMGGVGVGPDPGVGQGAGLVIPIHWAHTFEIL